MMNNNNNNNNNGPPTDRALRAPPRLVCSPPIPNGTPVHVMNGAVAPGVGAVASPAVAPGAGAMAPPAVDTSAAAVAPPAANRITLPTAGAAAPQQPMNANSRGKNLVMWNCLERDLLYRVVLAAQRKIVLCRVTCHHCPAVLFIHQAYSNANTPSNSFVLVSI